MLRIQECFSFKDAVGRVYKTADMVLSLRENTKVYKVEGRPKYLFVRLGEERHLLERAIRTMCECSSDNLVNAKVLWPEFVCYQLDDDLFCGFLARFCEIQEDLSLLSELVFPEDNHRDNCSFAISTGLSLAKCIRAIHQTSRRFIVGAPRPMDFHVDSDGQVYYFYAYRCGMDMLDQSDNIYLAPECRMMEGCLSQKSDSFSFAMIFFLLLTGRLPFGECASIRDYDQGEIIDLILNGESVYYYKNSSQAKSIDKLISSISLDISTLFRLTFDYCGQSSYDKYRPTIDNWITAIEKVIATNQKKV